MHKLKKNRISYVKFGGVIKIFIFIVFFICPFFVSAVDISSRGLGVSPLTFLENALNKLEKSISTKISGKAVVEDIYEKSLDSVKYDAVMPFSDSVDKTVELLNKQYSCSLTKDDVMNILYFENKFFKRTMNDMFDGTYKKPSKSSMSSSCNILNRCIQKGANVKISPSANDICQAEVSSAFARGYVTISNNNSIGSQMQGNNYFWNASLDDSEYDILVDIYDLSQLLFDDVQAPVEVHYFEMPKTENVVPGSSISYDMSVDRFSPYNTYVVSVSQTGYSGSSVVYGSGQNSGGVSNSATDNSTVGGVDDDIQNFITNVNYTDSRYSSENPGSLSLGNDCVSGFDYQFYEEGGEIIIDEDIAESGSTYVTPEEYLSGVLEDLEVLSCNHNSICESWESLTCPDCVSTSGGTNDVQEIYELVNSIESLPSDVQDDIALSCMQNCSAQVCDPFSCPKIVCYAKCACKTIESPFFDPQEFPGLSPVFKLKFCIIPVTDAQIDSKKKVYNIYAIFNEIYKVLEKLRNSGELLQNKKTKELVDSSYLNDSMSQLSFMITSTTKSHATKKSEAAQKSDQIETNSNLMATMLGFGDDMKFESEKNKYVVANKEKSQDSDKTEMSNAIVDGLGQSEVLMVDSEFSSFLSRNAAFWSEIRNMLIDLNDQANILKGKKN